MVKPTCVQGTLVLCAYIFGGFAPLSWIRAAFGVMGLIAWYAACTIALLAIVQWKRDPSA